MLINPLHWSCFFFSILILFFKQVHVYHSICTFENSNSCTKKKTSTSWRNGAAEFKFENNRTKNYQQLHKFFLKLN